MDGPSCCGSLVPPRGPNISLGPVAQSLDDGPRRRGGGHSLLLGAAGPRLRGLVGLDGSEHPPDQGMGLPAHFLFHFQDAPEGIRYGGGGWVHAHHLLLPG